MTESTAAGVVASTYGYNGGAHQRYVFEKAGAPRANMSNVYFFKNAKSGLYLQAVGKNVVQNKRVSSASSIPQSDFIWQIVEAGKDTSSKDGPVSIAKRRIPEFVMTSSCSISNSVSFFRIRSVNTRSVNECLNDGIISELA